MQLVHVATKLEEQCLCTAAVVVNGIHKNANLFQNIARIKHISNENHKNLNEFSILGLLGFILECSRGNKINAKKNQYWIFFLKHLAY